MPKPIGFYEPFDEHSYDGHVERQSIRRTDGVSFSQQADHLLELTPPDLFRLCEPR